MVRLKPVVDLRGHLILHTLASHSRLVDEKLLDETLCEAGAEVLVLLLGRWCVLAEVDLWAAGGSTCLAWRLVSVSAVETEHEFVRYLIKEGYIGPELHVIDLKRFGELDLDELIELFSALSTI